MFEGCSKLTSLDLSNFNTSNVTGTFSNEFERMFYGCTSLETLDLSGWNLDKIKTMSNMFKGCSNLKTIRMIGCNQTTIDKIKSALTSNGISSHVTIIT